MKNPNFSNYQCLQSILTNNTIEYSLPAKPSSRPHFRTDRKCHPDNEREEATLREARRGHWKKMREKSLAKAGTRRRRQERQRERSKKRDERGVSSASPPRGLVGLASGSVYRKQMGYACSAPYFTGIYCLLFGRSRYAHGPDDIGPCLPGVALMSLIAPTPVRLPSSPLPAACTRGSPASFFYPLFYTQTMWCGIYARWPNALGYRQLSGDRN